MRGPARLVSWVERDKLMNVVRPIQRVGNCVFLALSLAISTTGALATGVAEQLRCEYRVNPLGVDVPAPRLSWIMVSGEADRRGVRQTAYRILVASTPLCWQRTRATFGIPAGFNPINPISWSTPANRCDRRNRSFGKFKSGTSTSSLPRGASRLPGPWECSTVRIGARSGSAPGKRGRKAHLLRRST